MLGLAIPAEYGNRIGQFGVGEGRRRKTSDGPSADVWSLDIASGEWTALALSGSAPPARYSHDAAWNPATKQVIVFGGRGSSGALNDLWVFTP